MRGRRARRRRLSSASQSSAALGAAAGALAAAELAAPPALLATPVQLAAETLAVVAVELRMVGELHEVYGLPLTGTADEPGDRPAHDLGAAGPSRQAVPGCSWAPQLGASCAKRVMRRLGASVTTLAPFLAGAVAGAEVNRRETRKFGEAVTGTCRYRPLARSSRADRLIEGRPASPGSQPVAAHPREREH